MQLPYAYVLVRNHWFSAYIVTKKQKISMYMCAARRFAYNEFDCK